VKIPSPINPLNAELNPICHLLASLGAHHILHVSRVRVNNSKPAHREKYIEMDTETEGQMNNRSLLSVPPLSLSLVILTKMWLGAISFNLWTNLFFYLFMVS